MNAFTAQEVTTHYVRVPDDRLELAVDILSDIVWRPALRTEDIECERQVILEELRMHDDEPEDLVQDVFTDAVFPEHPIGREVIGSTETIEAMHRPEIGDFHSSHYHPSNVVVAVAGNLEHDRVVELLEAGLDSATGTRPPREGYSGKPPPRPLAVLERPTEQAHVVLGMRALRHDDPDRYALTLLNECSAAACPRASSKRCARSAAWRTRCTRTGRRSRRPAFSPSPPGRPPNGSTSSSTCSTPSCAASSTTAASRTASSNRRAGHLRGSLALSLESSGARMHRLGRSEITVGEVPTLDELVARVDAVTPADVTRVVERVLAAPDRTLAAVGPSTRSASRDAAPSLQA